MINVISVNASTGSDQLGDGTALKPLRTIQAAIELARVTKPPVRIQVAPGDYAGFDLQNHEVPAPVDYASGASLTIAGTPVPCVPSTGLAAGAISSAALNETEVSTITVNGAGWTPGELEHRFLQISGPAGGSRIMVPISGNSTDTLQLTPGTFPNGVPDATATFALMELGTVIDTPAPRYPTIDIGLDAPLAVGAGVRITNSRGPGYGIALEALRLAFPAGVEAIRVRTSNVVLQNCGIVGVAANDRYALSLSTAAQVELRYSIIDQAGLGSGILVSGEQNGVACAIGAKSSILRGGRFAVGGVNGSVVLGGALVRDTSIAGVTAFGPLTTSQFAACVFDNCTTAFLSPESFSIGPASFALGLNSVRIDNCATAAIDLRGGTSGAYLNRVVGGGNTVGIRLARGAFAGVRPSVALTGATELEIDGAPSDLAAMRAATPRVVRDQSFGSMVYELP